MSADTITSTDDNEALRKEIAELREVVRSLQTLAPVQRKDGKKQYRLLYGTHYQRVPILVDGKPVYEEVEDSITKVKIRQVKTELQCFAAIHPKSQGAIDMIAQGLLKEGEGFFPIIWSDQDLIKIHNHRGYMPKWELVNGDPFSPSNAVPHPQRERPEVPEDRRYTPGTVPTDFDDRVKSEMVDADTLSSMTVAELQRHAKEEGIELGGVTKKADIINLLRAAVMV